MDDKRDLLKLIENIKKDKGGNLKDYMEFISFIGHLESKNDPNAVQKGAEIGKGAFQFEDKSGSNRIFTAANRTKNYYKSKGMLDSMPSFINNIIEKGTEDARKLSYNEQSVLLLGDARMGAANLKDYVGKGKEELSDYWATYHWAGHKGLETAKQNKINSFSKHIDSFYDQKENILRKTSEQTRIKDFYNDRDKEDIILENNNRISKIQKSLNVEPKEVKPYFQEGKTTDNLSLTNFIKEQKNKPYFQNTDKTSNQNTKSLGGIINSLDLGNKNLNEFNTGGLHEQNRLGGIPQGTGDNGKMNTVEENETSFETSKGKFIFSNRITVNAKKPLPKASDNQFALGGNTDCGGKGQPPCTQKQKLTELSNKDINKGKEELRGSKDFIGNWIKSDRFKKKFKENLTEIDNNRHDPKYKGWYDNLTKNTVEEDVKKNKNAALKNLSTVIPFSNKNNREDRQKLSDEFSEIINETKEAKASREWMTAGTYHPSSHSLFVLDDHENTATHEYIHSTRLDKHLKSIAPQSDKVAKVLKGLNLKGDFKIAKGYFSDNPFVYKYDTYREKYLNHSPVSTKQVQEQLKKEGIDLNDINYLERSNEVYPRLMTFRKKYNIKPEDIIDDKKVEEIYKGEGDNGLFKLYSKKQVKEMLNKFANTEKNKEKNTTNTKLA